ncbi:UNVERIFIED_CONTAM: hypothetical protein Sangu_1227800 [Sesamum angustifolium]|uniref:RING-CH-type domain-containing protein n=1 Tax=Sesamum angustifolium TaxID=2727405 RepID=A0AAW2NL77_9LAMI
MDINVGTSSSKLAECRICHDEDEDSNMEVPCSCRGSLKYAHRKCVQRWCNEKGDTICEICNQFVVLVVLRHTLPFIISGAGEYSISLVMLLMLRTIGILLPIYIMVKALTVVQRRRNRQDSPIFPLDTSEEEDELPPPQTEAHVILVP